MPWVFDGIAWGHAQDLNSDNDACKMFPSVPGWLQDVQHAENWEKREEEGGESWLQEFILVHRGTDNKNVCSNVGRLVAGWSGTPLCLCTDCDLVSCIFRMLQYRLRDSVKVGKEKCHPCAAEKVAQYGQGQ